MPPGFPGAAVSRRGGGLSASGLPGGGVGLTSNEIVRWELLPEKSRALTVISVVPSGIRSIDGLKETAGLGSTRSLALIAARSATVTWPRVAPDGESA